jgi:hypothetical protein
MERTSSLRSDSATLRPLISASPHRGHACESGFRSSRAPFGISSTGVERRHVNTKVIGTIACESLYESPTRRIQSCCQSNQGCYGHGAEWHVAMKDYRNGKRTHVA